MLDCLRSEEFSQEQIDLADSYWSAAYQGPTATASPLMAKHWASLSDHRSALMDEQTLRFKLVKGMRGLYDSIAADLRCGVTLNTAVEEHRTRRVRGPRHPCRSDRRNGRRRDRHRTDRRPQASGVLPAAFRHPKDVVREGSNSVGFKIWIKVRGRHSIIAGAPGDNPISLMRSEYFLDDEDATILVGFGSDHTAIELDDVDSAQKAVNVWRDDLEVIDCGGHDWVADQWSGQTWATLKSGQFFNGWSLFQRSDTRLKFAGADYASGWNGVVVDGAIESGIKTARSLIAEFRSTS